MIKIKLDSFLLFDVNRNTVYVFKNRDDYSTALDLYSRFRELNDKCQFLPVHLITDLHWALKNCVDFYLVDVSINMLSLREWEKVAPDVVLTVED